MVAMGRVGAGKLRVAPPARRFRRTQPYLRPMATSRQRKRKVSRRAHHAEHRTVVPLFEHLADIVDGRRPMPESEAVYQHYVPQLHLRGFSPNPRPAKNALIWRLDKQTGVIEQKRVARVGGEKRFNRVKGPDDKYTNAIEAWLGIVEHHAAPALERLLSSTERPSYPDRITTAFYLAMQEMRTPHGLGSIENTSDMVFDAHLALWTHDPAMFADICRDAGVHETPEAIERLRKNMSTPGYIKMADARTHAFNLAISIAGDLTNVISPMTWTIVRSDEPLAVGDHPITHHDPEPPMCPWTEPTWASSPTAESYIPLNSTTLLRMTHAQRRNERDFSVDVLAPDEASQMNLRSYGWATQYVFAEGREALERVHELAQADPDAVPRASRQWQVITADERAFLPSEPNEQPPGWPMHVPRVGQSGQVELCRYKIVPHDDPEAIRAATEWSLKAERRLHPGARPSLVISSREDIELLYPHVRA
jgi:uncharacterized protein DUF4238